MGVDFLDGLEGLVPFDHVEEDGLEGDLLVLLLLVGDDLGDIGGRSYEEAELVVVLVEEDVVLGVVAVDAGALPEVAFLVLEVRREGVL